MSTYRHDIDGLRAVAVVPVVLFHAGIGAFSGGYVGVDVFFVISGFLISSIIRKEIAQGTFSIAGFYERRCRRILPALTVVLVACFLLGYLVMLPIQLAHLGRSASAAALFLSNVFFWRDAGYFAPATDWMPLLHTWSLAVEEQYYVAFPLMMFACRTWRPSRVLLLVVAALLASFCLSAYGTPEHPSAAFYLSPFRVWELLLGVVLSFWEGPAITRRWVRELVSVAGLAMIVVATVAFDSSTLFPGVVALLPCLGAAALIATGRTGATTVRAILSAKPAVFVGKVSYSWYLWHWPVLVFIRLRFVKTELGTDLALFCVASSFIIAALSWRYVESPFRRSAIIASRRRVFAMSGVAIGAPVVLSVVAILGRGFPSRVSEEVLALQHAAEDVDPYRLSCSGQVGDSNCVFGSMHDAPSVMLWGDSHAAAIRPALEVALEPAGASAVLVWQSACPPLLGAHRIGDPKGEACERWRVGAITFAQNSDQISTVVLMGRWVYVASGKRREAGGAHVELFRDDLTTEPSAEENPRVFERALHRTVSALRAAGKTVVLLGGTPEMGWDVPAILALSAYHRVVPPTPARREQIAAENRFVDEVFVEVAGTPGVTFIPLRDILCVDECRVLEAKRAVYSDDDHLSMYGARSVVGPAFAKRFEMAGVLR